jgi:hypothetical protein
MTRTILILAANPRDTSRLRLDQEVREIDNGLQRAPNRREFILKQQWATRPKDVRRAMLNFKPSIVHFCGHGGEEGIAFEDETGQAKLVSAEALAGFFELFADKVECVVLNACYSEIQAEAIAQHIDYVIGMKKDIGDIAAIEFAVAFYDTLGAGESIEFAYQVARNAVQWADVPEHLTPILKPETHFAEQASKKVTLPTDLMLEINEPEGFNMLDSNRFSQFSKWLSNPLREGDNEGSFEYPIKGQVLSSIQGLMVEISIHTNRWWPQGKCLVRPDGTFSGTVFLDQRQEPMIFRFDILTIDGDLLKRFEVPVT